MAPDERLAPPDACAAGQARDNHSPSSSGRPREVDEDVLERRRPHDRGRALHSPADEAEGGDRVVGEQEEPVAEQVDAATSGPAGGTGVPSGQRTSTTCSPA